MPPPRFHALVVDDDPIARRMVGHALIQEGFDCAFAVDGEDALHWLAEKRFELVVTDLRMPNKHGHALAVELLRQPQPPLLVVHSAIDDPSLTKDLIRRGVDDVIYKPANYAAFAAKVKALLQRRQRTSQPVQSADAPQPRADAGAHTPTSGGATPPGTGVCPVVSRARFERRLASVGHLLPRSSAAHQVYLLSQGKESTVHQLVETMVQDANLTADLLRLAGNPYFNRSRAPTEDTADAVMRIGFKRIGEIGLALSALAALRKNSLPWLNAPLARARGLAAGIALQRLSDRHGLRSGNDGLTLCAFLHPLGRLVLGAAFPDEYDRLIRRSVQHNTSLVELESEVFPESPYAALGRVLRQWQLPIETWGPLVHLGQCYAAIERLDEPLRSRVELIKLAIWIGENAVGQWLPWDHIEPPPMSLIQRHQLPDPGSLIARGRVDVSQVLEDSRLLAQHRDSSGVDHRWGATSAAQPQIALIDLRASQTSWMAMLMMTLGFDVQHSDPSSAAGAPALLVNGLDVEPSEIAKHLTDWPFAETPQMMLLGPQQATCPRHGTPVFRLPASAKAIHERIVNLVAGQPGPTRETAAEPISPQAAVALSS